MKKTTQLFEMAGANRDDFAVINNNLTLLVESFNKQAPYLTLKAGLNILECDSAGKSQGIGGEAEYTLHLTPGEPLNVKMDGTDYQIALKDIGTVQDKWRGAYADLVITWNESPLAV
jgi:hypothetical protein